MDSWNSDTLYRSILGASRDSKSASSFALAGVKVGFCTAAVVAAVGATASSPVWFQGGIFSGVAVPIAWNATNNWNEFFVVILVLGLGIVLILVPMERQFAAAVLDGLLVVNIVVLFLLVVLDDAVVVVVVVGGGVVGVYFLARAVVVFGLYFVSSLVIAVSDYVGSVIGGVGFVNGLQL